MQAMVLTAPGASLQLQERQDPTPGPGNVRVRINAILYVDYLSYHRVDGDWLITAKAFHVECENLSS